MISLDLERLMKSLSEIPQEDEFDPEAGEELKKLFLVLAGDQRVINKLTLEDMAMLFNDAAGLLDRYVEQIGCRFNESILEDYVDARRRAV